MQWTFATPDAAVSHIVASYYLIEEDYAVLEDMQRADVGQLRIFLRGSGYYEFGRGVRIASTRIFLTGPFTQSMKTVVQGPVRFIGISLMPQFWGGVVNIDAASLSNSGCEAAEFFGVEIEQLHAALSIIESVEEMARVIDAFLIANMRPIQPDHRVVISGITQWLASATFPDLAQLYAGLALSDRQVTRIANRYFGAPPKTLARTYGALKTASSIVMNGGHIPDEAVAHYADKSHLIREVRRVTGQTPRQLVTSRSPIMRMTLHSNNFKELACQP